MPPARRHDGSVALECLGALGGLGTLQGTLGGADSSYACSLEAAARMGPKRSASGGGAHEWRASRVAPWGAAWLRDVVALWQGRAKRCRPRLAVHPSPWPQVPVPEGG